MRSLLSLFLLMFSLLFPWVVCAQTPDPNTTLPTVYRFEDEVSTCLALPYYENLWTNKYSAMTGLSIGQWQDKFSARLVFCMRHMLEDSTKQFLAVLIDNYATNVISTVIILAMAIFGYKVLGGMFRNAKGEAFLFIYKIAIIMIVIQGCRDPAGAWIVDFWYTATDNMVELLGGASLSAFSSSFLCPTPPNAIGQWFTVWDRFDCLFQKLMGFGSAAATGTGLFAIAAAVVFSAGWGIWLAFMIIGGIFAVAQLIFRSVMVVMMSYGGLSLLLLLLPLYIPLILFKNTQSFMWNIWLRYATGYVLQPAITVAFLFFSITVLDSLMMNGSQDVYTVFDPIRNETRVVVVDPGTPPPPRGQKAIRTPAEILGFNYGDSVEQQEEDLKRRGVYQRDKRGSTPHIEADVTAHAYMKQNCGSAGNIKPGEQTPTDNNQCANKKKCAEAALKKFQDSPNQNTSIAYTKAMCEWLKSDQQAVQKGGAQLDNDVGSDSVQLNLNAPDTPDGMVPDGQVPQENNNQHESKLMQLLGYVGSVIICCGTFLTSMKFIPTMVQNVCGVPGQSLSLSSPMIAGKSLMQRISAGLTTAKDAWKDSLKQGTKMERGVLMPLKGFVAGFINGSKQKNIFRAEDKAGGARNQSDDFSRAVDRAKKAIGLGPKSANDKKENNQEAENNRDDDDKQQKQQNQREKEKQQANNTEKNRDDDSEKERSNTLTKKENASDAEDEGRESLERTPGGHSRREEAVHEDLMEKILREAGERSKYQAVEMDEHDRDR